MNYIVTTEKMVFGGSCIANIDGKTVFIPNTLPNEKIEIEIIKERKNYFEARLIRIIEKSIHRVEPRCQHFYSCGGCNLQFADDEYQHQLRYEMATEAFRRACKQYKENPVDADILEKAGSQFVSGNDWEYRSRFQLHTTDTGFAQKKEKSSELIAIKDCPIAVPKIRDMIASGTEAISGTESFKFGTRLHIFSSDEKIFTELNQEECYAKILNKKLKFNPLGFFQSNLQMTEKLINIILTEIIPNAKSVERVLDFYSGIGTFSFFTLDLAKEIHLVEHNKHALSQAEKNFTEEQKSKNTNAKIFYHPISDEAWAKTKYANTTFDFAFVDPPRSGIDKNSIKWFCKSSIKTICYVSCDPVSFARDAVKLIGDGYKLSKHFVFDFYPQTHHVETLGIFVK